MASKPMFRVETKNVRPSLRTYEVHMPDNSKWRYAYGRWEKITSEPLERAREIKPRNEQVLCLI